MNFDQPYPSARSPVCAQNVVSTSQPLATQAGLRAMHKGGNAVDAALAAAITLTVVEPCNNGVGSDAFAIIADGKSISGLNASGRAPAGWSRERFAGRTSMPQLGWDSITVPGAVSAWTELSDKYGSLPFEDLFEDAIRYAHDGFMVGPISADLWQTVAPMYEKFTDFAEHFLPAPQPGETIKRAELAETLQEIAATKGASFYRGKLAHTIANAASAAGASLSLEDLERHHAEWVTPIQQSYLDVVAHEIPPNGQGLAALIALGILGHFDVELDTADGYHLQIEAMKMAVRAAFDHISDPEYLQTPVEQLLDPNSQQRAAKSITSTAATIPPVELPVSKDTVYLCAADSDGLMVSFIQSNYLSFGSGIVIPKTGISMQNRGYGFSLQHGHPNEVGSAKRPFHTIIPGFVTSANGAPLMAYGVMGGHMQHQGHVQMLHRVFGHQQNPQTASDAPRWIVNPDFSVSLEQHHDKSMAGALADRGHRIVEPANTSTFGGAQLILKTEHGYIAGSDHRKEGYAGGF